MIKEVVLFFLNVIELLVRSISYLIPTTPIELLFLTIFAVGGCLFINKFLIPTGLYWVCVILFSTGFSGVIFWNLRWGITIEENTTIILGLLSLLILLYGLIKKKKSKDQ